MTTSSSLRALRRVILAGAIAAVLAAPSARAGNGAWLNSGPTNGNWSTGTNWVGGTIPGATSGTTNPDLAAFDTAVGTWGTSLDPILIDLNRNFAGINFTTFAGNYTLGTTGGNALKLSSGGSINILNTLVASNAIETVNAPLQIQGPGGFVTLANESANGTGAGAGTLLIGSGITGGAAGATVLTLAGSNTNANTVSGVIANGTATSLALSKSGLGTWNLTGASSFTGDVTVNGGTLVANLLTGTTATALGARAGGRNITVNSGGTLRFAVNNIFGGSGMTPAGLPKLVINAGGTVSSSRYNVIGNVTLAGGTLTQSSSDPAPYVGYQFLGTVSATGTVASNISTGNGAGNHLLGGSGTTFSVADATGAGSLLVSTPLFDPSADYPGTGALVKTGAGTLILSGANTYSGTTTLTAGTLRAGHAGAFGSGSLLLNAGTLDLAVNTSINAYPTTVGGSMTILSNTAGSAGVTHTLGTLSIGAQTLTVSAGLNVTGGAPAVSFGAVTLTGDATFNPTTAALTLASVNGAGRNLFLHGSGSGAIAGVIGTTTGIVDKDGSGTWTLSGANTYSGGTNLFAGTLNLNHPSAIGTGGLLITSFTTLGNSSGAAVTLSTDQDQDWLGSFTFAGPNDLNLGIGTVKIYGTQVTVSAGTLTVGGLIIEGVQGVELSKAGPGTLVLNRPGFYSGSTLTAGTLRAGHVSALGNGTLRLNGGTLDLATDSSIDAKPTTVGGNVTILSNKASAGSAGLTQTLGTLSIGGQTLTVSAGSNVTGGAPAVAFGAVTLTGAATFNPTTAALTLASVSGGHSLILDGSSSGGAIPGVIGTTGGTVTKQGTGTWTLSGANTYTGATLLTGGALVVNGAAGTIKNSTALVLGNNAGLTLSNTIFEAAVDRLGDGAGFTSNGGTLNYNNTPGSGVVYAEIIGAVNLAQGQLRVALGSDMTGGSGNKQTLTLGGLTSTGAATATFSAPGAGLNATTNIIKVAGAPATAAGHILAPWATVTTGTQLDYVAYNASSNLVRAALPATLENTWTTGKDVTFDTDTTLSAPRTLNTLRFAAPAFGADLALGAHNLETFGFLNGTNIQMSIKSSGGVIRQPGTAPANLYLITHDTVIVFAPIADHTGALTLVKSGGNPLRLSAANTFSGGVVLNAGQLQLGHNQALGSGTLKIYGGALDTLTGFVNANNNAVTIEANFTFTGSTPLHLGTGPVSLGAQPGTTRTITTAASTLTLGGAIANGATANALRKEGPGTLALTGANTYTGNTTVNAGTVRVDNDGTTTHGRIAGSLAADALQVNPTGTLLLARTGAADRLGDTAGLTLAGGTLSLEGVSSSSETAGLLTLTADSAIDFGTGDSNRLLLSGLSLGSFTLSIYHWTGSLYALGQQDPGTPATQDRLLFTSDISAQALTRVSFYSGGNGSPLVGFGSQVAFSTPAGSFEVLPMVPEPSAGVLWAVGLVGLAGRRWRRRADRI